MIKATTTTGEIVVTDGVVSMRGNVRVYAADRDGFGWDVPADSLTYETTTSTPEHLAPTTYKPLTPEQSTRFAARTYTHSTQEAYGYTRHYTDGSSLYFSIGD